MRRPFVRYQWDRTTAHIGRRAVNSQRALQNGYALRDAAVEVLPLRSTGHSELSIAIRRPERYRSRCSGFR